MPAIKVTEAGLRDSASRLQTLQTQLEEERVCVDNDIKKLMEGWEGEAAQAYHDYYESAKPSLERLSELIEAYSKCLNKVADTYKNVDHDIAQMLRGHCS